MLRVAVFTSFTLLYNVGEILKFDSNSLNFQQIMVIFNQTIRLQRLLKQDRAGRG
jgi:hypothetical protein